MEIALTPELEDLIHEEVQSGRYPSPGEVIRDALRLFRRQSEPLKQELDALRQETQIGIDDLESGAYTDYDEDTLPQLVEDVKARGLERLRAEETSRS
jgi:antitoxin ParD1/3/4